MKQRYHILLISIVFLFAFSCNTARLSTADAQFDRGEYFEAANTYRKVYNKTSATKERKLRGSIAAKMGICYELLNIPSRATASFTNAIRYQNSDSTLILHLARNQHKEGKYREAIRNYVLYQEKNPNSELATNGHKGSFLAQEWKENKTRYQVRKMDIFNSRRADFSPMLLNKEGDQLYLTTAHDKVTGTDKSEITGLKPSDIYFSKKNEKGIWQKPEPAEGELNTEFDEGTPAFTPDGNTMYFTRARRDVISPTSTEIFISTRSGGKWGAPQKVEITKDTLSVFAHPAISPDEKYIYFVSDMPGGYGGKDIWRAPLSKSGIGPVENLGDQINTSGNEMFPTFRQNGILYFSSDGHPGMGGLDIFRARQDEWDIWHIENMQAPLNSQADDFGMTFFNQEEEQGFFASNRGDGRGYDHIYSFYQPSIKVLITGQVTNRDEEPVAAAIVRIVGRDGSNHKIVTKNDGTFSVKIDRGIQYVMMAGAPGYLNDKEEFRSDSDEADATYEVNFILASISKPVLIDNIFYDFDKASLRPESIKALDELIGLLNDNPNVTIELAAHTDRKGSEEYNNNLSQRRADSVIEYLISGGIERERLTPVGYGKSKPKTISTLIARKHPFLPEGHVLDEEFILSLTPEQQEIADQINRRTEFQVLDITYGLE
ncbi:MAG: OmpA family protein [Bacteroidales bacterium]